jgi:hypothetical protein
MAAALDMPITERSDGRSVTEVFRDEGYLWSRGEAHGYTVRFPMIEEKTTKQGATDWCLAVGVKPSA